MGRGDDEFIRTLPDVDIVLNDVDDDHHHGSGDDGDDSYMFEMPSLVKNKKGKKSKKKKKNDSYDLSFDGLMNDDMMDDDLDATTTNGRNGVNVSAVMQKVEARMRQTGMSMDDDNDDDEDDDDDEQQQQQETTSEKQQDDTIDERQSSAKSKDERKKNNKKKTKMERVVATPASLNKMAYFSQMNLSRPLLKAVEKLHFKRPTPVQSLAIPHVLGGADVLVSAMTGSGKTAAFMLPILERLLYRQRRVSVTRVLVVAPTRELAAQCQKMTQNLACFTDIRVGLIVGGLSLSAQQTVLRTNPDIIIATPGRLIDHLRNSQSFTLDDVEILVLDEADRLLDKGFADELREIVKTCPRQRQSMLFSATLSDEVSELVNLSLNHPKRIVIDPTRAMVSTLAQEFVRIRSGMESDREAIVVALCKRSFHNKTIVFFRSKSRAHRMMIIFGFLGLKAAELHGNLTQTQRLEALDQFRDGHVDFLLCTDLAARGLDIKGVETVINVELPNDIRQYIHRVGRTARAGTSGRSVTLAGQSERAMMREIVRRVQASGADEMVKSRSVPPNTVGKYREKVAELEDDIRAILKEERIEKELRIAEMEANKAQNLYLHRDEIVARPQKTWFQTKREKQMAKQSSLDVYRGAANDDRDVEEANRKKAEKARKAKKDPLAGLSRRKKRMKLMRMEMEKEKRQRDKLFREGENSQNVSFTVEQREEHGVRKRKQQMREAMGDDDDDDDMNVSSYRYARKSRKNEFDQRYAKQVNKTIARANAKPKKKKVKTSKAKYKRRR